MTVYCDNQCFSISEWISLLAIYTLSQVILLLDSYPAIPMFIICTVDFKFRDCIVKLSNNAIIDH